MTAREIQELSAIITQWTETSVSSVLLNQLRALHAKSTSQDEQTVATVWAEFGFRSHERGCSWEEAQAKLKEAFR